MRTLGLLWILVAATGSIAMAASDQDGLVSALKSKYPITQTSPDHTQIAQQGIVMHIVKSGINARPWDSLMSFDNLIVDGAVQQRSRWVGITQSTEARLGQGKNLLILQPGDKVYISKIESRIGAKEDFLNVSILSCDPLPVDDGASQKRYAATLSFKMPRNSLAETAPDQVAQMLEAMLAPDSGDAGGGKTSVESAASAKPRPAAQASTTLAAPALAAAAAVIPGAGMVKSLFSLASVVRPKTQSAAPAAQAAPAPQAVPQDAAAQPATTQTIALGQTIEQVVAAMGQPKQIIDLGAKTIYTYPSLKVVFMNGKVSDVQ